MKLVVTGSRSFIGREFFRQCAAGEGIFLAGIDTAPGHVEMDIRDPRVATVIPEQADALIHLAAISRDADCRRRPKLAFEVNVGGTLNLIEAARARGVRQFIFASSEWVYGEVANDAVQTEESVIDASRIVSEYALTKIAGERLLEMTYRQGSPTAVTVLRFSIVYGERPENWSAVESLFHAVERDPVVEVNGSLASGRRFIHVADVASGILAAIGRTGYEVFNLSGDSLVRLREVIEVSSAILDRHPQVREGDPGAVSIRNPDNAKARRLLGWQPQYDLRRGLETLWKPR